MNWLKVDRTKIVLVGVVAIIFAGSGNTKADFTFGTPTRLGPMVNSWSDDYSPCLSADGLSLYFASTRLGGLGGYDLWVSTRETTSDDWGPAENLGSLINSPEEDVSPAISPNGLELYFTSFKADGQGGADIWVVRRQSTTDSWEQPENLGPLINSTAHEVTPILSADGLELYFTSGQENGESRSSLYVTQREFVSTQRSTARLVSGIRPSHTTAFYSSLLTTGIAPPGRRVLALRISG
jgi:Tol biopolymer transport system component